MNLTSNSNGGAVYGENGMMYIGVRTRVIFMHNTATYMDGAAYLLNSMIIIAAKSYVTFTY